MINIPNGPKIPDWISERLPPELATSSLFRFKVKLQASVKDDNGISKRQEIVVDMLPDLDLDYDMLEQQMYNIPSQYAFWAAVYSEVRLAVAVAERKLKARKGEITKLIQKEAASEGVKLSVEQVKMIVESDTRLNEAEMAYQNAQMQAGKLYHTMEALKMKLELSRSLLGVKKKELDSTN